MTAHWIKWKADGCLSLEAALIAFHCLVGRHDGKALASTALAMLDHASATLKVSPPFICARSLIYIY